MGFIFGGPTAWKVKPCGEIVVAFHWVNKGPSMCLYPARRRLGASVFVIPLDIAHAYADRSGYPSSGAMERCFTAARVMGMEPHRDTIHNIMTAILDNIEDLVRMPPEPANLPKKKGRHLGEISLKADGKVVAESEVDVPPMIEVQSLTTH